LNNAIRKTSYSIALLVTLSSGGCWQLTLGPVQAPYVATRPPYDAKILFPYREDEEVLEVIVCEELGAVYDHTYNFEIRWHIKAVQSTPARKFEFLLGRVPTGFNQVFPENNKLFIPVGGRKYVVKIKTDNWKADYCCWWTPK
jgi:hypothetical protein